MHWYRHMTYIYCQTLHCHYKIIDYMCVSVIHITYFLH